MTHDAAPGVRAFGCQSMTGRLRRVLVRPPARHGGASWQACGWRAEPDPVVLATEHEAFCTILADAGAELIVAEAPLPGNPDAIYVYDPCLLYTSDAADEL